MFGRGDNFSSGLDLMDVLPALHHARYCRAVRIVFETDEANTTTEAIQRWCESAGHELSTTGVPLEWPEAGRGVGESVASGAANAGVVCCWTGTGVSMAANKIPGARAALCVDAETARGARKWNDANVLAISLRLTTPTVAEEILAAFFGTTADESESDVVARVESEPS